MVSSTRFSQAIFVVVFSVLSGASCSASSQFLPFVAQRHKVLFQNNVSSGPGVYSKAVASMCSVLEGNVKDPYIRHQQPTPLVSLNCSELESIIRKDIQFVQIRVRQLLQKVESKKTIGTQTLDQLHKLSNLLIDNFNARAHAASYKEVVGICDLLFESFRTEYDVRNESDLPTQILLLTFPRHLDSKEITDESGRRVTGIVALIAILEYLANDATKIAA